MSRHDLDWDSNDELLQETETRLQLLGNLILKGAWFLSPRFTVSSQAVSAAFFRAARHARSRWLKEARDSISLRREARSVSSLGRRAALADLTLPGLANPANSPPPTALTLEQRLEARQFGQFAKQMTFGGIMFIGGDHVLPRTWNRMADGLLGPEPPARSRVHRRRATQSTPVPGHLKPTGNPREPGHEGA